MKLVLEILLVITSLALMALILLHRGKGGGLSSMFGGGMQSALSGSSVVEKNLDRLTLFTATIWTVCIVGVGLLIKYNVG
jgi:preprotein translocase subunit SecG